MERQETISKIDDKLSKKDIMNSIDDIKYDIDYLENYSPQSDELRELKKQLKLYQVFFQQNFTL